MTRPIRAPSRFWPLLLMGTLMVASHWQVAPIMPDIEWVAPDKLAHFAVFGLLATLWLRHLAFFRPNRTAALSAWVMTAGFGLVDELIQSINPVRFFDPADLLADSAGALVAIAAYFLLPFYRGLLEAPLWRRRQKLLPAQSPS